MSRQLRIEYPDAWYRVMNRGESPRVIVDSDELRKKFLPILSETAKPCQIEIHAYIVDNSFLYDKRSG